MKWLTLELIKANSRIDGNEEDTLLELYGNGAEQQVLNDTARTYEELLEMGGGESVPSPIIEASLLLVDASYNVRSAIDRIPWNVVPYAYERRIKPYMKLTTDKDKDE